MHTSHSRRVRARYTFLLLPITLIACGAEGSLVPPPPPPAPPASPEKDEVRCPEIEINQLERISDVTDLMTRATRGLEGPRFFEANRAEKARIEKECAVTDDIRCDVVSLYHGGRYDLYQYKRYQ